MCDFIKKLKLNIVLVYGVNIIKEPLFSTLPTLSFNIHSGIIPRYRGTACNFWPFYFLEPNWAGVTLHYLIKELDMGNIVHQVTPELEYGDSIHEVSCKAIVKISAELEKVINLLLKYEIAGISIKNSGKVFYYNDFRPEHLRIIYNYYNDKIVDEYLNCNIKNESPKLVEIETLK